MSRTTINGREVIYSGFAVTDESGVIEVTLTHEEDTANIRFHLSSSDQTSSSANMIAPNFLEISIILPNNPFTGGLPMQRAGELAGKELWMGLVFTKGPPDTGLVLHYIFCLGGKING
jgi:hypothetical protein